MRRLSRGFSLIELMVVMTMIAIMLALAAPSFAAFISNYRVTAACNDILQAITATRTEALKRGRRVTLIPISADWRNGWTIFVDTNNDLAVSAGETVIYKHDPLPGSIAIAGVAASSAPFGVNYVTFDGTGYPRTTANTALVGGIVMTDHTGSATNIRTLCLSTYGRPRIVKAVDACSNS